MQSRELSLTAEDGKSLFVYHWAPDGDATPRGAVHIAHGMAEHAGRYVPVAEVLTGAGYLVWAHDHRGHGRTAESDDELGFFAEQDGWRKVVADLLSVRAHIAGERPDLPCALVGHSMGSYMAQDVAALHGGAYDAVVLSGSNRGGGALVQLGRGVARLERLRQGMRGKSPVLEAMSFGAFNAKFKPNRTQYDWLSRDPHQVDLYVEDPRCGFRCTDQLWVDLLDALARLGRPANFEGVPEDLPLHVMAGSRDPVSNDAKGIEALVESYRAAGLTRLSHRIYSEARHEIFNESNRDEVLADLRAWLDDNLGATRRA